MIYLLNTPILTAYGDFRFTGPLDRATARQRLTADFISAIGHEAAADFLSSLLGRPVPVKMCIRDRDWHQGLLVMDAQRLIPRPIT